MTAVQTPPALPALRLTGLKAHHPLGFLAACGTLRCVTLQGWHDAKLWWPGVGDGDGGERVAVLHSGRLEGGDDNATQSLIAALAAQAAADAVDMSERSTWLNWADKFTDVPSFRMAALKAGIDATGSDAHAYCGFACLGTDAAIARGPKDLRSLFDMTSARQSLLKETLGLAKDLANQTTQMPQRRAARPSPRSKCHHATRPPEAAEVPASPWREALLGPWQYKDDQHSFGLDPVLQRLHALRNKEPEDDKKKRCVRAAVFLARQALPLFPVFCSQGRTRTTGFARGHRGRAGWAAGVAEPDDWFTWPIWDRPISVDTVRTLLAQRPSVRLAGRGVVAVYRSRRAKTGGSQGDFRVLTQPELHKLL